MPLAFSLYETPRSFLETVGEMLYARETVNNLMLGITEQLIKDPHAYQNPFFAAVTDDANEPLLAVVMTPPHNLVLAGSESPEECVSAVISHLQTHQISIPGVIGPVSIAETFASAWQRVVDQAATISMSQRVYELRAVRMPPIPLGHFRVAGPEDRELIARWFRLFNEEALGTSLGVDLQRCTKLIEEGHIFVWENDGHVVSMAMKTRPIAHSITISGVYTPAEHRQHGYATALVARLSEHLLSLGYHFVNLFTDLSNPTSNKIYQKIGFHPVSDFRMYAFTPHENQ